MSEQEIEEQLSTGSDEQVETTETGDDVSSDETHDDDSAEEKAKKNKSNWKKVSEKAKQADILQAKLEEAQVELEAWRSENPEIIKSTLTKPNEDKLLKKIFLIENPEAKEHLEKIDAIVSKSKGWIDRDEAWELIKGSVPKESKSKTDFSTKSQAVNLKKDILQYTEEEAIKLDKASYAKWATAKGYL